MHGLRALVETIQQDKQLTVENISIGVVGPDEKFHVIDGQAAKVYLDQLDHQGAGAAPATAGGAAMDVDNGGGAAAATADAMETE